MKSKLVSLLLLDNVYYYFFDSPLPPPGLLDYYLLPDDGSYYNNDNGRIYDGIGHLPCPLVTLPNGKPAFVNSYGKPVPLLDFIP